MSELITLKVPDGTKARLKTINPNISDLLRKQIDRLVERKCEGSIHDRVSHLCGIFQGPGNASTSKDYLKQYAKKNHP
jgi:hypothetical protein